MDETKHRSHKKILCIGAIMADITSHVPALPQRGEGVVVTKSETHLGGCAFNSGNIIRQLDEPCYLFAPIGQGVYASFVRSELEKRGLCALEVETALDCGSCLCLIEEDGERTMITTPGIERCFEKGWFELIDASEYDLAFASGYEIEGSGGDAILSFIEANPHISFWYAPGPRVTGVSDEKTERIMALRPCWHLNDLELSQFAEKTGLAFGDAERAWLEFAGAEKSTFARIRPAGEALAAASQNAVVVTLGAEGAAAFFPNGEHLLVPTDAVTPIDTVGAGDTHLGALVAALHAGCSWADALELANRMAAAVCQHPGGTIPDEAFVQLGVPKLSE